MTKRTLLIIGAGHEQVPAIKLAHDLGYRVIATDRNPSAPGFGYADVNEIVSTADAEGNLAIARRHAVDGVI